MCARFVRSANLGWTLPSPAFWSFSYASKPQHFIPEDLGALGERRRTRSEPMTILRILVVEDDSMLGELRAEMLQMMGHEVCGVENTEADAVTAAFIRKPDLMIVDAWLRDGSGVSAVDKICDERFIPHFFVSGDISRIKALRPGAVAVQKPFREADLVYAIQRAFKGSK
jgi:DNA-binding NtrC family response regulator